MSKLKEVGILQNEVLTVNEVATYLRLSRVTIWRWCQQGIIPAWRVGRNWRICRQDLLDYLEESKSRNLDFFDRCPADEEEEIQRIPDLGEPREETESLKKTNLEQVTESNGRTG